MWHGRKLFGYITIILFVKFEGDWYGFVYKITNKKTKDFYYGAKSFCSITNLKISKKKSNEIYSGKGRKPTRLKKKESDWKRISFIIKEGAGNDCRTRFI